MKKYVIAILLVLVLVSIAYIKAIYSSQDRQKPQEISLGDDYISKDDVVKMADSLRLYFVDSVYAALSDTISNLAKDSVSDGKIAELNQTIDSLEKSHNELFTKFATAQKDLDGAKNDYSELKLDLAEKYYQEELKNLPVDLTDYEKTVSVKEIKSKTKEYFGLSTKQLNGIAQKYN
jgi:hypothetical protein